MRILGIDPGLDRTGYGIIEVSAMAEPKLIEAGLIRSEPKTELALRLATIAREMAKLMQHHRPDAVAVEDLYSYYKTPKPAVLMGHVRGVILAAAAEMNLPVASYLPTRIKMAVVGKGHAGKAQVAYVVQVRLKLTAKKVPPDVTDALAVALCHASHTAARRIRPTVSR